MICVAPRVLYRAPNGKGRPSGYRPPGHSGASFQVGCGQCLPCRINARRVWGLRGMHEAQCHDHNWFPTLTYSDDCLPASGSLVKAHYQNFLKSLRNAAARGRFGRALSLDATFKYAGRGEYGDTTLRPHYHLLLFGCALRDLRYWGDNRRGNRLYESPALSELWGRGNVIIGAVEQSSVEYVMGHNAKAEVQALGPEFLEGKELPFVTMSRRPGIGADWVSRFGSQILSGDFVVDSKGRPYPTPAYYLDRLERESPDLVAVVKDSRRDSAASPAARAENRPLRRSQRVEAQLGRLRGPKRRGSAGVL